jgi:hypothetical protein
LRTLGFLALFLLLTQARQAIAGDTVVGPKCDVNVFGEKDKKEFLTFDKTFRAALKNGDAATLSSIVEFPLRLNYGPGVSVSLDTPATLQAKFQEAFPPEIRNAVLSEDPAMVWCNYSGVMYANGAVWADDIGKSSSTARFVIVSINLPDSLSDKSKSRKGRVDFICDTGKHHIVVDEPDGTKLRYRSWSHPYTVTDKPDMEIVGGLDEIQGTGQCTVDVWTFKKGDTEFDVSRLGCTGDPQPPENAKGQLLILIKGDLKQQDWCY